MISPVSSAYSALSGYASRPQGDQGLAAAKPGESKPESSQTPKAQSREEKQKAQDPKRLDPAEKQQVAKLKQRDAEVRAHEQAHLAAAGNLALGGPNYVYQSGPDGRQYAIGGDVQIDTSPGRTPEETAQKAKQIRAAALAPSDPSPQDLKVAAAAATMEREAASKLEEKRSQDAASPRADKSPSGEITSARQVFASSPTDSQEQESPSEDGSPPSANPYLLKASQAYNRSQSAAAPRSERS